MCRMFVTVYYCQQLLFSVARPKKVNLLDPKATVKMLGLNRNVEAADITKLFNAAADFVDAFLDVSAKFVAESSSYDSTGTLTTEDEDGGGGGGAGGNKTRTLPTGDPDLTGKKEFVYQFN